MSLLGRLQQVVGAAPNAPPSTTPSAPVSSLMRLRAALDRTGRHARSESAAQSPDDAEIARRITSSELREDLATAMPGGHVVPTEHGPTWSVDTSFRPADRHGDQALAAALDVSYAHLEQLTGDARLRGFDPRDALYLDIEATGLEHGAGTMAFMIGLGFMVEDVFIVRQLILRDHDEERALLQLVWEALERHRYLVSFNGKSFDLSVLQNRLVMNRFCTLSESELKLRPHLDLLHLGRSLYKKVWSDVRLQTLEKRVLGFVREDDMPGHLAPLCWFQWLREADARPLAGIARHNLFDVLSMLSLAGSLAVSSLPIADAGRRAAVTLNLAQTYTRRRAPEAALAVLEGLGPLADGGERIAAHRLGATCARRSCDDLRQRAHLEAWLALEPDNEAARAALTRLERRLQPKAGARRGATRRVAQSPQRA